MDDLRLALIVVGVVVLAAIYLFGKFATGRRSSRRQARAVSPQAEIDPTAPEPDSFAVAAIEPDTTGPGPDALASEPSAEAALATPPGHGHDADVAPDALREELRAMSDLIAGNEGDGPSRDEALAVAPEAVGQAVTPGQSTGPASPDSGQASGVGRQAEAPASEPERVIVVTVMAQGSEGFPGRDIAASAERLGLQHGAMDIYHFAAAEDADQPVFSMASMVEPGTFDLAALDDFATPGLVLFMTLPGPGDPAAAFERMLGTGRELADQLRGRLLDGRRSVLTEQAVARLREEIGQIKLKGAAHARQAG